MSGKPEDSSACWSGSAFGFQIAVASKESQDLGKPKGVKILLSGLLFEFSDAAEARSWRRL